MLMISVLLLALAAAVSWVLLLGIPRRQHKTNKLVDGGGGGGGGGSGREQDLQPDLQLPPGRMGLPWLGETLDYLRMARQNRPWQFVTDRVTAYGSETFKTSLYGSPMVVVASPAGGKMTFANTHPSWPSSLIKIMGSQSLLANTGHRAQRIRNALHAFLNPDALKRYTHPVSNIVLSSLLPHIDMAPQYSQQEQEPLLELPLYPFMHKLTFSIVCHILVGIHDATDQHSLFLHFDTLMRGILKLPINVPNTPYGKAVAASHAIRSKLQSFIDIKRTDSSAVAAPAVRHQRPRPESVDVLSCLLAYEDGDGKLLSDEEIKDNLLLMLFAGNDTSSSVATMACRYLALHPSIMDEVYKENREIITQGMTSQVAAAGESSLRWEDLQKMKLTWRVVQETLRLQAPGLGIFRVATQDMSFDGYRIPKSWKIFWSTNSTVRNPKYFPEPEKFDPSRFEGAGPAPFTYAPFGGGARMCPGYEFARMEILIILHHLVTRFSWTLKFPEERIMVDAMPVPEKGLPVLLQRRRL